MGSLFSDNQGERNIDEWNGDINEGHSRRSTSREAAEVSQ
jgi:hypothetical protein